MTAHLVADVRFTHHSDGPESQDAPVICSCQWDGTVGEWNAHKPKQKDQRARHRQRELTVVKR